MKKEVFDTAVFLSIKFLAGFYMVITLIMEQMLVLGFNLYFLYVGLIGQIVATLVDVHSFSSRKDFVFKVTWGKVINTVAQLLIAPVLAFLITSMLFKTLTPYSALAAFSIGAFWEFAWRYLKRQVVKKFKDEDFNN